MEEGVRNVKLIEKKRDVSLVYGLRGSACSGQPAGLSPSVSLVAEKLK